MKEKLERFYQRWNISNGEEERFIRFRNRILHCFDAYLGYDLQDDVALETRLLLLIGEFPYKSYTFKKKHVPGPFDMPVRLHGMDVVTSFQDMRIGDLLTNLDYEEFSKLALCIQCVFWLEKLSDDAKEAFYRCVNLAVDYSGVQLTVKKSSRGSQAFYVVMPKGAHPLDKKLVNDVLDWLQEYPEAQDFFRNSLKMYLSNNYREAADNARLSFENFLKQFFPQDSGSPQRKGLEKFTADIKAYLLQKNVLMHISQSYKTLFHYYQEYQNFVAKHKDERGPQMTEAEAEYAIYLTGLLMRFLIQVGSTSKV